MARSLPAEEIVCEHCGDRCRDASITMDDKPFCCTGCLTVYQLLHDNSLDDYYTIENRPGRKVLPGKHDSRFAYLDDPDVVTRLLDFDNGQMARMTFSVPQMHCASCVWLLENLYVLQKAVTSSRVDFPRREVSITWAPDQLSLRQLVEQLAVIGYEPTIRLADLDRPIRDRSIRMLYARLAVAGFAFGNVMLLSFPEYLGLDALATPAVADMFGWVNLLLALPVVAFSGWEFFRSAISGLRQRQINMDVPISLGILVLFLRSVHHIVVLGQGGYVDSLAGLVFLLLIGRLYQKKTYAALSFDRDYKSYLPLSVVRVQADGDVAVPVDRIQPGDRIRVRNRELIPADGILIDGPGRIDYSFVTGESDPVPVTCGEKVFAGGRQMGSALTLDVIKSPSQSYLMQLWTQGERVTGRGNGVISLSDRVSRIFTPTVVLLSLLAGVFWAAVDPSRMLNAMSAVLIVACPCALALSTPFTLGTISRIFGSNDFYLKDPSVVERLARVSSVVFDKTGTITSSQSTVPDFVGDALTDEHKSIIRSVVRHSTHPSSVAIAQVLAGVKDMPVTDFVEEPGRGVAGRVDGHAVRVGSHEWVGVTDVRQDIRTARSYVAIDDRVVGYYQMNNVIRDGLPELVDRLRGGYRLSLLSGDRDADYERMRRVLGTEADLRFEQSPQDKLAAIQSQEEAGERVLMIGDGLNDAGALKVATVGVSMLEDGASFSPASDGILRAGRLARMKEFLGMSREALTIIKISFALSFLYNLIGLTVAVQGLLSPLIAAVLMPASSVSVVLFATLAATYRARRRGLV